MLESTSSIALRPLNLECKMSESKFKTMRHIETVRNYLNSVILDLMARQEYHDQTKLKSPEVEVFEEYTPKLRDCTYGSDEYKQNMKEMKVAIGHHNRFNRHHPEHFDGGIKDMDLVDLIEMICDWRAASLRHNTGDIYESIEINQKRFGYSDELKNIFKKTADRLIGRCVYHKADES